MSNFYKNRQYHIKAVFIVVALVLILRALTLQVIDSTYRNRAEATTIDKVTAYPSRGLIYDRKGELLVYNNPIYDLMVTYNQIPPDMRTDSENPDTARINAFCEILNISKQTYSDLLNKDWKDKRFSRSVPYVFLGKLSAETNARLQESLYKFPGFYVQTRHVRGYPHVNAAHVLGYIQEVDEKKVESSKGEYVSGDYIGASGLELAYEKELKGKKGCRYVLKDNLGREVGSYNSELFQDSLPVSGKDLITSLDLELQQYGELLMQNKIGGILALDPKTGGILAMVSTPTYDPNKLNITRERGKAYAELIENPNQIFFNRATMAEYPPGSLFKPVVALIALQEGVTQVNRTIPCHHGYYYGGIVRPACHGHPQCTNVGMAIQHSCNAYFAELFRNIVDKNGYKEPDKGLQTFAEHLRDFGLGDALGIDFLQEKAGNIPTPEYYNKVYGENRWFSPYIMSLGIGQGEMLMTNVQMANVAALIGNKGQYFTPHLVTGFKVGNDTIKTTDKYLEPHYVRIDTSYFQPVIDGMEMVVRAGTARIAYIPDIPICGKTGTAENPHGDDHSIFFAFAPKDNPQIAIAVYVEHGVWGARYAAPIASLMIEKYIRGEISAPRKYLETNMLNANLLGLP